MIPKTIRLVDVATKAGVSRVAAGNVLLGSGNHNIRVSEVTAARIRKHAREMGYQPNRSAQRLKGKTGCLLGAVMKTDSTGIELKRLLALESLAFQHGHQVLITTMPPDSSYDLIAAMSTLAAQGAAGIIFVTAGARAARRMAEASIMLPVVCCDIPPGIGKTPGVVLDLAHGYRQAIRHLIKRGRRRIGVLNIQWGDFTDIYSEYRLKAVREEAAALPGVQVIEGVVTVTSGDRMPSLDQAKAAVSLFLKAGVDAILAYSDIAAARLVQVLLSRGVNVPEDVAICGLSNLEIGELISPQLTTIDERPEEVAQAMLKLLLAQLASPHAAENQLVIQSELIVRESA